MVEKIGKIVTLIVWAAIAYHWLVGVAEPFGQGLHWTGIGLLVAHAIECAVFYPKIKASGYVAKNLLLTYLYGYFHANFIVAKPESNTD